jgi:hypothetical protein
MIQICGPENAVPYQDLLRRETDPDISRRGTHERIERFLMQLIRTARWLVLALFVGLIPASANAGVFISVGVAPPPLPVYVQPECPEPGMMWTPGYWAYGDDGYYWVPGTWVPAPSPGLLWTPAYWGWSGGQYIFHGGYWGPHVGYYGGVNYGFGYGGIGFAGGMWLGGFFSYNTAVMHVGFHDHVYMDRGVVERGYVARDSHVAFSGGPGGIRHEAGPEERMAERDHHIERTSFQQQHESVARSDRNSFARNNGGHPSNPAVSRPLGNAGHPMSQSQMHSAPQQHGAMNNHIQSQSHSALQSHPASMQPQSHTMQQSHSMQQPHPAPQQHSMPQQHSAPQQHAAPQQHTAPAPHNEGGGKHK